MTARRLDGTAWAARLRAELEPRVERFTDLHGRPPGLAVVLAGSNPASEIYVRNKIATVAQHGCRGELFRLPGTASVDEALALVERLNQDDDFDGILVQSPLPEGMGEDAEQRVFDAVDPAKDVDGFHPVNVGRLVQKRPALVACTPLGCAELLDREGIRCAASTPWSSAAATSWASPWRCCCCTGTPRSRSVILEPSIFRPCAARPTSW